MKKIAFILLFVLTLFWVQTTFASLSISPLKFEFNIEEQSERKEKIKITNNGASPITLYSSSEDFIAWDDSWTPKFVKASELENPEYSLSRWIEVEWKNVTLAPWESREIYFTIKVPANAEPGWHYAAVFFSPWVPGWAQVAVVQRLWVLILVEVPWEVKISWDLKSFKIWNKNEKELIENNNFKDFPIIFQTIFENSWNVHLKPKWKITLMDESGEILKNIWKETLSSPAGAYIWEKMVDYIPINDTSWNVLPRSERRFETSWQGFWYTVLNEDGTRSVLFKNLEEYYADRASEKAQFLMFWESINTREVKKEITAMFELSYEWKDKEKKEFLNEKKFFVTYKENYVWLNYTLIWILSVIVIIILIYVIIIAPKQKAQKEEALRQRIMEEMKKNKE